MDEQLRQSALEYHQYPTPGKIQVAPTKPLTTQRDLALAYSPGVAAACDAIVEDPNNAYKYTSRGNLVAVISNGTAILGLGNIGRSVIKVSAVAPEHRIYLSRPRLRRSARSRRPSARAAPRRPRSPAGSPSSASG